MSKRIPAPGLVSYRSVMELLDCSRSTVKRLVQRGLLPPPMQVDGLGSRWWEDDILRYLRSLPTRERETK